MGGKMSRTVMRKLQVAWLPWPSVAVQTTVVAPSGNRLPEGGLQTTVTFVSQTPVAPIEKVTGVPRPPWLALVHSNVPNGQLTVGGVVQFPQFGQIRVPKSPQQQAVALDQTWLGQQVEVILK